MKANELRIGNYYQEHGKIYKISITDLVNLVRHELMGRISDTEPIPTTKEWLERFGFRKYDENLDRYYSGKFDFMIVDVIHRHDFYFHYEESGQTFFVKGIKYVHQLQNLYFALTGEELTQ